MIHRLLSLQKYFDCLGHVGLGGCLKVSNQWPNKMDFGQQTFKEREKWIYATHYNELTSKSWQNLIENLTSVEAPTDHSIPILGVLTSALKNIYQERMPSNGVVAPNPKQFSKIKLFCVSALLT